MKPHKHAELIKAWADGASIQRRIIRNGENIDEPIISYSWLTENMPMWSIHEEYRIKPEPNFEPKPNWYRHYMVAKEGDGIYPRGTCETMNANLRLYFDGNTGMLIDAELIGK